MVSLAALFIDVALIRSEVRHEEAVYQKLAAHMPLLARIRAEILSKTVKDGASWRERAAMLPRIAVMALICKDPSLPFASKYQRGGNRRWRLVSSAAVDFHQAGTVLPHISAHRFSVHAAATFSKKSLTEDLS